MRPGLSGTGRDLLQDSRRWVATRKEDAPDLLWGESIAVDFARWMPLG
jgi:hypothetical protein